MIDLTHYFENADGIGILATCDPGHMVDQAIYSKPFVIDESTVAFVMKPRHSHKNLKNHLQCSYLFLEAGGGYRGLRLHLTMHHEETNRTLIEALRKKQPTMFPKDDASEKFLVFFKVDQIRPLVGDSPAD